MCTYLHIFPARLNARFDSLPAHRQAFESFLDERFAHMVMEAAVLLEGRGEAQLPEQVASAQQ